MINLLPFKEKQELQAAYRLRFFIVELCVGAALILSMSAMALPSYFSLLYRAPLLPSVKTLRPLEMSRTPAAERAYVLTFNKRIETLLSGSNAQPPTPMELFSLVSAVARSTASGQTSLKKFEYTYDAGTEGGSHKKRSDLKLSGIAPNRASLHSFIAGLEKLARVRAVDAPIANFLLAESLPFSIVVHFK